MWGKRRQEKKMGVKQEESHDRLCWSVEEKETSPNKTHQGRKTRRRGSLK